jgi:DNA repair exonuclease SbcCD ATPase subunit
MTDLKLRTEGIEAEQLWQRVKDKLLRHRVVPESFLKDVQFLAIDNDLFVLGYPPGKSKADIQAYEDQVQNVINEERKNEPSLKCVIVEGDRNEWAQQKRQSVQRTSSITTVDPQQRAREMWQSIRQKLESEHRVTGHVLQIVIPITIEDDQFVLGANFNVEEDDRKQIEIQLQGVDPKLKCVVIKGKSLADWKLQKWLAEMDRQFKDLRNSFQELPAFGDPYMRRHHVEFAQKWVQRIAEFANESQRSRSSEQEVLEAINQLIHRLASKIASCHTRVDEVRSKIREAVRDAREQLAQTNHAAYQTQTGKSPLPKVPLVETGGQRHTTSREELTQWAAVIKDLQKQVEGQESRLQSVEQDVQGIRQDLANLRGTVNSLQTRIGEMNHRFSKEIEELQMHMRRMEAALETIMPELHAAFAAQLTAVTQLVKEGFAEKTLPAELKESEQYLEDCLKNLKKAADALKREVQENLEEETS